MQAAIDAARRGMEAGEVPIGAVVADGDRILSCRHTEERTQGRRLVHADFLALDDADRLALTVAARRGLELFVTLEPCVFCLGAAMTFGIGRVYYALEAPTDGGVKACRAWADGVSGLDGYNVPDISGALLREESLALLKEFASGRSSGGLWRWTVATLEAIEGRST